MSGTRTSTILRIRQNENHMFAFVVGLAIGFVMDVIWSRTPGKSEAETMNTKWDRWHVIEHYHWSLVLMMIWVFVEQGLLLGIASALLVSEWTGDTAHPFATGKKHFVKSTIIGIALATILAGIYLFV